MVRCIACPLKLYAYAPTQWDRRARRAIINNPWNAPDHHPSSTVVGEGWWSGAWFFLYLLSYRFVLIPISKRIIDLPRCGRLLPFVIANQTGI